LFFKFGDRGVGQVKLRDFPFYIFINCGRDWLGGGMFDDFV
jgi:hypothetical protein